MHSNIADLFMLYTAMAGAAVCAVQPHPHVSFTWSTESQCCKVQRPSASEVKPSFVPQLTLLLLPFLLSTLVLNLHVKSAAPVKAIIMSGACT